MIYFDQTQLYCSVASISLQDSVTDNDIKIRVG